MLGVVFPSVRKYLADYFDSLLDQTYKDFDLVLLNDGLNDGLDDYKWPPTLNIIEIPCSGPPASIRERGINHALDAGYERLVFTDTDDYFAENRLERCIELLMDNDIVVNDLTLVDEDGSPYDELYISGRLKELDEVGLDFMMDRNIMGLSNTAIRMSCLSGPVSFDEGLIAVDWHFFSTLLLRGCRAVFTGGTVTFYRQYGSNTVGLGGGLDEAGIRREVEVKALHYAILSAIDRRFALLAGEFKELKNKLENSDNISAYMEDMKAVRPWHPLWWEAVRQWQRGPQ